MKLSDERLAEYNSRMNDWISKQGLLFQLTHGGTGLGNRPPVIGSFVRAIVSILLLALIASIGYGSFLFWKATGDELPKQFRQGIMAGLAVEETTASGFKRDMGSGSYRQIQALGSDESFFNHLDAREISFQMEPLTGLFGEWEAKTITISELKIALKAGEADQERAEKSWQALFMERPSFSFQKIEIADASLSWGYTSSATWGSVIGSQLNATRIANGWNLQFRGGFFSQGIFRDFAIKEIVVEITADNTLTILSANLKKGDNPLTFKGKMTSGGARPLFEFEGQFTGLPLTSFLPRALSPLVTGDFSGDFSATGSTNDSDGIRFQISARPEGKDGILLTKEIPLLRMLSHLDPQRSYRKLSFNQGSFSLETKGNILSFKEIDLISQEPDSTKTMARLTGGFEARPATKKDLDENTPLDDDSGSIAQTIGTNLTEKEKQQANLEFGSQILSQFKAFQFENPHREFLYVTKGSDNENLKKKRVDLISRRQFRVPFVLDGQVKLAVPASAFENSPPLPQVSQDEELLRQITINLEGLVTESSRKLRDEWENSMEEADPDNF